VDAVWRPATQAGLKKAIGAGKKMIVLADSAGTSYVGVAKSLGPNYIELTNGQHELTVWYSTRRLQFITLDPPTAGVFGVKTEELPL